MLINRFLLVLVLAPVLCLFGCGPGRDTSDKPAAAAPAAGGGDEADYDLAALLAQADTKRGRTLFLQCRACHSLGEGEPHKVGPNLYQMFGKTAGVEPGFAFSDALVNSGIVWSPETLDPWMARPSEYLPGNKMVFIGIKDAQDRANLIAYLQEATAPQP
ncbi:MAG: cytochrome c family protein [Gammaproteobacteria bacterium]|nr:cytochrome c family protein [Gammaproteobacteria bacterium]